MNRMPLTALAMIVALTFAAAVQTLPARAAGDCLSDREAQAALSSGQIEPVAAALASAGIEADAKVLSVRVCRQGDAMVYVVAVLGSHGDARNLTLPAGN